jgi:hypothetical protein
VWVACQRGGLRYANQCNYPQPSCDRRLALCRALMACLRTQPKKKRKENGRPKKKKKSDRLPLAEGQLDGEAAGQFHHLSVTGESSLTDRTVNRIDRSWLRPSHNITITSSSRTNILVIAEQSCHQPRNRTIAFSQNPTKRRNPKNFVLFFPARSPTHPENWYCFFLFHFGSCVSFVALPCGTWYRTCTGGWPGPGVTASPGSSSKGRPFR